MSNKWASRRKFIAVFLVLAMVCVGFFTMTPLVHAATTIVVAKSGGNYTTIQAGVNAAVAGDTVLVQAGTYHETVYTDSDGQAGNRITLRASGIVNVDAIEIEHDYITVDGFHFNGGEVRILQADYCEVLNNDITNGWIYCNETNTPTGGLIKGNYLHNTVNPGGDFQQITLYGSNFIVEDNEIGPSSDIDAFRIWGHDHIIRNNYVHDITYSPKSKAHMDIFQTFGDQEWESYNITIENNRFINSEGQLFNTSQDGVEGIHDYIVRNNIFANFHQNANVGLPNFYLYNNTFYNTGTIYQVEGGPGEPFNGTNLVVKNNVLIGLGGLDNNTNFDWVYRNPSGLSTTRSNNFYSDGAGNGITGYESEPGGINGGVINFNNVSAYDFSLVSPSPAINAGVTLTGFNYDINGTFRPQGSNWDIGAYEYGSGTTPTPTPTPTTTPTPTETPTPTPTPTATPTPTPTPAAYIGYNGAGTTTDTISDSTGNYINLSRFQANSAMTVSKIYAKLKATTGKYKFALYSDNAGNVGSLMAQTGAVSNPSSDGWYNSSLASSQSLTSGTYYWIAVWSNAGSNTARVFCETTGGNLKWTAALTYGNYPSTVTTTGGSAAKYCIYAQ